MRFALALAAFLLLGCNQTRCDEDFDCLVLCECPNLEYSVTISHRCQGGFCGRQHAEDLTCERPCNNSWGTVDEPQPTPTFDDDDSGEDVGTDDDDSGR